MDWWLIGIVLVTIFLVGFAPVVVKQVLGFAAGMAAFVTTRAPSLGELPAVGSLTRQAAGPLAALLLTQPSAPALVEQVAGVAHAVQRCQVVMGFALLEAHVGPSRVGQCLEDERFDPATATSWQQTTGGLLVWKKAENVVSFTDGYRTWLLGPAGVQQRLNIQRFCWESDAERSRCLR